MHFYDEVSAAELYEILTHHRGEIEGVLGTIEAWLADHPERLDTTL